MEDKLRKLRKIFEDHKGITPEVFTQGDKKYILDRLLKMYEIKDRGEA